jgi:acetylglutamate kinase
MRPVETVVLKVGGGELDDPGFLTAFVDAVREVRSRAMVSVVHGGGKQIAWALEKMGLGFEFVDGLRVTTEESVVVVEMVLSGMINKRLVGAMVSGGLEAAGMSGKDLGLIRVEKLMQEGRDLGYVGRVVSVRGDVLLDLMGRGISPVISPVSLGLDGATYNVNADPAALAVAQSIGAGTLAFVTDVPGVSVEEKVLECISANEAEALIEGGQIFGGMIPKVRAGLTAVAEGIPQALITDLSGLQRWGRGERAGTRIIGRPAAS